MYCGCDGGGRGNSSVMRHRYALVSSKDSSSTYGRRAELTYHILQGREGRNNILIHNYVLTEQFLGPSDLAALSGHLVHLPEKLPAIDVQSQTSLQQF